MPAGRHRSDDAAIEPAGRQLSGRYVVDHIGDAADLLATRFGRRPTAGLEAPALDFGFPHAWARERRQQSASLTSRCSMNAAVSSQLATGTHSTPNAFTG